MQLSIEAKPGGLNGEKLCFQACFHTKYISVDDLFIFRLPQTYSKIKWLSNLIITFNDK